jgi:hypothetical protein
MGPITSVIPVPRPLRVAALDGHTLHVAEMRLSDLAELQGVLDATWSDPYLAARASLEDAAGESRWPLLVAAYEAAEAGPPVYGEGAGAAYFVGLEGFCLLAWVALRRHQPDLDPADVATLVLLMDEDERFRLRWIAEGGDALRVLGRMLLEGYPRPRSTPITWGQAIHEVTEVLGVAYEAVYRMTLTEFRNARRSGKPEDVNVTIPDGADIGAFVEAQSRRLQGINGAGA